ncbi:hypothetical protein ACFOY4_30860 [Actinomadura syzygii]|uniref:Uncharacterized protein n=1 Tax=Actinomadura syzygii TaxID=1427538 RepID=A0A5D0TSL0_9ACTN|nr:hypothetical protein [Actinomadura syzygii]TYC08723.1 hypothetical protein FXF65_38265 [Actinomadura syzygii]
MKRLLARLALVPFGIAAVIGLVGVAQQPASAEDEITVYIYGANFPHYILGEANFRPDGGGQITTHDQWCDGDNGIVAAVYRKNYNEWQRTALSQAVGCGSFDSRPGYLRQGDYFRLRVCKLLPDKTWKDCVDRFGYSH